MDMLAVCTSMFLACVGFVLHNVGTMCTMQDFKLSAPRSFKVA